MSSRPAATADDAGPTPFDACSYCGETFETDVRYPVVVREPDDSELVIDSFCDEYCETAWRAQRV